MTAQGSSNRILFALIAVLSLAGMIVSLVSLQRHYAKSATAYCEFGQKFNCDIVNRSQYSTLEGIPVAGIGVAGYAALFVLATFWKSRHRNSESTAGRGAWRTGFRSLPDLYRSL